MLTFKRSVVLFLVLCACVCVWWYAPWMDARVWREGPPPPWAYRVQKERAFFKQGKPPVLRYTYVPLNRISRSLQRAVLVGEDAAFYQHGAVDWYEVEQALKNWWKRGKKLRGASTLSQQLAKNLFLNHDRSFFRKLNELRWACWLERSLGKRRILELYLNVIELGTAMYGVEAGSVYYFGTHASSMGYQASAGLAATIPSPHKANPHTATRAYRVRKARIAARMGVGGVLEK